MKRVIVYISALILMFLLSACEKDRCFKKLGDEVNTTEVFEAFSYININGIFEVDFVQDSSYYIETIAPEAVAEGIDFEVAGDTIECYNYNSCFWRRGFDRPLIRIHFSEIERVNVHEASYLFSSDTIRSTFRLAVKSGIAEADLTFNNDHVFFYINKSSGGRYNFNGKCNYAHFISYNTGYFDMQMLECKKLLAKNSSTIDMKVFATEELIVEILNTGNILYKGNPTIIIDSVSSSGRVLPLN